MSSRLQLRQVSTVALIASLTWFASLAAAPPPQISYQGVLRDAAGNPRSGSFAMTFRFFDASVAGNEILVDNHAGASTVVVDGGLFDVSLGSGTLSDGAAVLPGDPYLTLAQVFRDFSAVWMQISVGAETLMPRVQVLSTPYALNASNLNGLPGGSYLDTSSSAQTKAGPLTVGSQVDVFGRLRLRNEFFASVDFAEGNDPAACRVAWDIADDALEVSRRMQVGGPLMVGNTTSLPPAYNRFGSAGAPDSGDMTHVGDVYVEADVEVDGSLYLSGTLRMKDEGPDGTQQIQFYDDGAVANEILQWDDSVDRFELTNALATEGPLRVGNINGGDVAYNHLGAPGTAADAESMDGVGDLFVAEDVEVDGDMMLSGNLFLKDSGDDASQFVWFYDGGRIDDEWFSWDDAADRFEVSDSLHVYGDLTANLKNFVQNHPTRSDLEVVYTSLEGDEVTVFTRGTARLEHGVASVVLGESFGLVANPSYGLSAQLTPRGTWAELYVARLSPQVLEVRAHAGAQDAVFDYVVYALRAGYEQFPAIRARRAEAPLPSASAFAADTNYSLEAARSTAAERYLAMHRAAFGLEPELSALSALTTAIGRGAELDPPIQRAPTPEPVEARLSTPASAIAPVAPEAVAPADSVVHARTFRAEAPAVAGVEAVVGAIAAGDIVIVDPASGGALRRSDRPDDPRVVGIAVMEGGVTLGVSTAPSGPQLAIAWTGIVPCHVDATFGAIEPGDLLVSSPTPGHAMKAHDPNPGTVVGKALDRIDSGTATIRVLVMQR